MRIVKKFVMIRAIRATVATVPALVMAVALVSAVFGPLTVRAQTGQQLFNEGFETGYVNDPYCKAGDCKVPQGWGVWFIPRTENDPPGVNAQPKYDSTSSPPTHVKSGQFAERIWTDNATHTGGIYRVVKDVQVGAKLRFSAWGQVWSTNDESPISARPSHDIRLKIGVDPLGGNNGNASPLNGQVVWSTEQSPTDAYTQFTIEVEAKSPTIIVYTYATMKDNVRHNEVYWDDAVLEYIAPPPTATPAPSPAPVTGAQTTPAQSPVSAAAPISPTAAPVQSAAVTYTIKSGDTLFGIALDQNVSLEDLQKNNPGVQPEALQLGQVLIIKPGVAVTATVAAPAAQAPAVDPNASASAGTNTTASTDVSATNTITATPAVGKACVEAYFDNNGDGKKDETEDLVPNILFTISADGQQKGSYTTTGVDEPYCFSDLPNGDYTVAATIQDIYQSTTPLNDTVTVRGAKSFFTLGLRRVIDGNKDKSAPSAPKASVLDSIRWNVILPLAGGTLLLVGAFGFLATLFMRRRRL